jgi:hypothetical protein
MAGRAIRIPDAAFARRRIVTRRDIKMGVAMLVEVRAMPIILPVIILPILPTLPVFLLLPVLL